MYIIFYETVAGNSVTLSINEIIKNVLTAEALQNTIGTLIAVFTFVILTSQRKQERYSERINRFKLATKMLHNEQPSIISVATRFYNDLYKEDDSISTRAMIAKKDWLYKKGKLRLVKEVKVSINDEKQDSYTNDIERIFSDTRKIGRRICPWIGLLPRYNKTLVENAIIYGEAKLWNGKTYALTDLDYDELGMSELDVYIGNYFEFYNTCMGFSYETADSLLSNKNESRFKLREKYDIFNLDNRYCTIGIVTLTLLHTSVNGETYAYMLLHQRGKDVSESQNLLNAVPAGSYQPTAIDPEAAADNLVYTIAREFGEELFSKSEYVEVYTPDKLMKDPFFHEIQENTYLLGGGFNPQNCFFEILTLSVLDLGSDNFKDVFKFDSRNIEDVILEGLHSNHEGEVQVRPFSKDDLTHIANSYFATPALKEIAHIIGDNYDAIVEQVF